jgi:hypothetical protein
MESERGDSLLSAARACAGDLDAAVGEQEGEAVAYPLAALVDGRSAGASAYQRLEPVHAG